MSIMILSMKKYGLDCFFITLKLICMYVCILYELFICFFEVWTFDGKDIRIVAGLGCLIKLQICVCEGISD